MFKRYQVKMIVANALPILLMTVIIGSLIFYFSSRALVKNLEESLIEIASQGAKIVEKEIDGNLKVIETIAGMESIKERTGSWEGKQRILEAEVKRNGFRRMSIADPDGYSQTSDGRILYVGDREYFIRAIQGQRYASDPLVSRIEDQLVTTYAVPIYNQGEVIGVLYATRNARDLSLMTEDIKLGVNGTSFITNSKGEIIAYEDWKLLYDVHMQPEKTRSNPKLTSILGLQKQITNSGKGIGEYTYEGEKKIAAFAPIHHTSWYLTVAAPKSQIFRNANLTLVFIMCTALVVLITLGIMGLQMKFLRRNLYKEQVKSRTAINTASLLIIGVSKEGKITGMNLQAQIKTGYRQEEVCGVKTLYDIVPESYRSSVEDTMKKINEGKRISSFELPIVTSENSLIYILWNASIHRDPYADSRQIEIIGIDMTERAEQEKKILAAHEELTALYEELSASEEELKQQFDELAYNQEQLRKSEERYSFVIEASDMGIWDHDMSAGFCFYSTKWYDICGLQPEDDTLNEEVWYEYIHPEDAGQVRNRMEAYLQKRTEVFDCEYRIRRRDGTLRWIRSIGKALWDRDGNPVRMAGSHTDITDKKEYENRIQHMAYYDALTGLYNRARFEEQAIALLNQRCDGAALFFIDIDNFKYVNDSFGHTFGDSLVVEVAKRITDIITEGSMAARLGGDEFAVFLPEVHDIMEVQAYADELLGVLNINFSTCGITLNISASIGIAVYPEHGRDFEELLKNADTAMYKAKESGKRNYAFFDQGMDIVVYERITLESNLRRAIENNEFVLYYQPLFDLKTRKLRGFEALIRWNHPVQGFMPPAKFIPLAEETELIIPIGVWTLKTACGFIKQFHDDECTDVYISVNVSVIQLLQDNFVDVVLEILQETGLNAEFLELEITETVLMECIESSLQKIMKVREKGVRVALDDFGTGYSSLTYLKQLPLTTLKIEKEFIHNIVKHKQDKDITESIIQLAHTMGLHVVAEGVETMEQLECLAKYDCDIIQGYLVGVPLPEEEAMKAERFFRIGDQSLAEK